jgi:hypothetical protein
VEKYKEELKQREDVFKEKIEDEMTKDNEKLGKVKVMSDRWSTIHKRKL